MLVVVMPNVQAQYITIKISFGDMLAPINGGVWTSVLNVFTIPINVRHLRIPYSPFNCYSARSLNLKNLNEVTEKPREEENNHYRINAI